jgi:hypothetical protein
MDMHVRPYFSNGIADMYFIRTICGTGSTAINIVFIYNGTSLNNQIINNNNNYIQISIFYNILYIYN